MTVEVKFTWVDGSELTIDVNGNSVEEILRHIWHLMDKYDAVNYEIIDDID